MTEEERAALYREEVLAIPLGPDHDRLVRDCWEHFEAVTFELHGDASVIYDHQEIFAVKYLALVRSFYDGEISEGAYRQARVAALKAYADRLFELGLLNSSFPPGWIVVFAQRSLAVERDLVPVPKKKDRVPGALTDEDAVLLCGPLRDYSKQFFEDLHRDFGVGRMRRHPKIVGGVDHAEKVIEAAELPNA